MDIGASVYDIILVEMVEGTSELSCKPANSYLAKDDHN